MFLELLFEGYTILQTDIYGNLSVDFCGVATDVLNTITLFENLMHTLNVPRLCQRLPCKIESRKPEGRGFLLTTARIVISSLKKNSFSGASLSKNGKDRPWKIRNRLINFAVFEEMPASSLIPL